MPDYITTASGRHVDPLNPDMTQIMVEDIAHALSMTCRGNGHVRRFFSVGDHCIWCAREAKARGYSSRIQLACLLHDGGEAYLSDVPSPLKKNLPEYCRAEEQLLDRIYEKFLGGLTEAELETVDLIDHQLLAYDLSYLLGEGAEEKLPAIIVPPFYGKNSFSDTEKEYLDLYREIQNM